MAGPQRFRERRLVVVAEQFDPNKSPLPKGVDHPHPSSPTVWLLQEGENRFSDVRVHLRPGDWIVTDAWGKRSAIRPGDFAILYETAP